MSDWTTRLRSTITLQSPDGTQFVALWTGNDIEGGKRVGLFDYPMIDGTVAQDLGLKGWTYPLTLSFEGATHDIDAWNFTRAFSQRGSWNVIHPVYGSLTLQPLSPITIKAQPITSANVTVVETTWLEPVVTAGMLISASELGAQITDQVATVSASTGAQFTAAVDLTDPDAMAAAMTAGLGNLGLFNKSPLSKFIAASAQVQATFAQLSAVASAALAAVPMDIINTIASVQGIMQLPALAGADLSATISGISSYAGSVISSIIPGADALSQNAAVMGELFLTGAVTGAALTVANTTAKTQDQSVQSIKDTLALFTAVTTGLDAVQTASAGNIAASQYFSNSGAFADLAQLIALTAAYLLRTLFDLKIAKRFTLAVPRACIEIVIAEYGAEIAADGTDNYALFIASNKLIGRDIVILPAGREVVVYV